MSAESEVREASRRNSEAMNHMLNGDASKIASIWSQSATLSTLHPTGTGDVGDWEAIRGAYEGMAQLASEGRFELKNASIYVLGDIAYETGTEHVSGQLGGHPYQFTSRVTNIYRREAEGWKMLHHHAEIAPILLELLQKVKPR